METRQFSIYCKTVLTLTWGGFSGILKKEYFEQI